MTGADFLLPIAAGAAISWASYSVVAHAVSKQHISTLRATVWGALGTLSLVLGVCAFSAVGAEHQTARKDIVCADDNPECYAKTHHNPVRECKKVMDESKRLVRTVLIFTESSDQLSRATDRVPGLPASPGYVQ